MKTRILPIVLSFLILDCLAQLFFATALAASRYLEFPERVSVGRLLLLAEKWRPASSSLNGKAFSEARGLIKLAPGQNVMLVANTNLLEHLDALHDLPADALAVLVLDGLEVHDQDLSNIAHLTGLQRLELIDTDVSDAGLQRLYRLVNLRYLSLSRTMVKGKIFARLALTNQLHTLLMDNLAITPEACHHIAVLFRLRVVSMNRSGLNDQCLAELSALPRLESLLITGNAKITNAGIRHFAASKNLQCIELADTAVTPAGLLPLKNCPLKRISFGSRYKSDPVIVKLKQTFPDLQINFEGQRYRIPAEMFAPLH